MLRAGDLVGVSSLKCPRAWQTGESFRARSPVVHVLQLASVRQVAVQERLDGAEVVGGQVVGLGRQRVEAGLVDGVEGDLVLDDGPQ